MSVPVVQAGPPAPVRLTGRTVGLLRSVRRRHLCVGLAEFPVRMGLVLPLVLFAQALADWTFELSWTTRRNLLCADAAAVVYLLVVHAVLPYHRRLGLRTATLLIERAVPRFRTSLVSAVELTASPPASHALLRVLVRQVDALASDPGIARRAVPVAGLKKRARRALFALLAVGALACLFGPRSLLLGRRLLLSRENLPHRTTVDPLTKDAVVAAGSDFGAAARALGVVPTAGRVTVTYDDGRQESASAVPAAGRPDVFAFSFRGVRQPFRYRFLLNDGVGEEYRVTTRTPLAFFAVHFTQTYPDYTGLPRREMPPGKLALLAGGRLRIDTQASKPLRSATLTLLAPNKPSPVPMTVSGEHKDQAEFDLALVKNGLTGFTIHLVGADGTSSENDPTYPVELIVDKPPVVAFKTPQEDKLTVVTTDQVPLAFTARDDFGLNRVELVYEIYPGTQSDDAPLARGRLPLDAFAPDPGGVRYFTWDLAKLLPPLAVGYAVNFWIEAVDNDIVSGPNVGRTRHKAMRVVSEDEKKLELVDALSKKASEIERLYDAQQRLNQKTDSSLRARSANP